MTIKAGELIHVGGGVLIDRLQTAGPTVNQSQTTVKELGNYNSVDVTREIPDLSFPMESFDVRPELEALLTNTDFTAMVDGDEIDMSTCVPINILGQYKRGRRDANPYNIRGSAILPHLYLETLSYRFGLRDNASKTATLRGDALHYNDASAYEQRATGSGVAGQDITLAHTALPYNGDTINGTRYAVDVSLASGERLFFGVDYTETVTGVGQAKTVHVVVTDAVPATDEVVITYFSPTVAQYLQASHAAASGTAPAAIRGKDIELRVGGLTTADRWSGVQSTTLDWRVSLDRDEEFGNAYYVSQDFDVPDVTGTVDLKPKTIVDFIDRIRQIAGAVPAGETIGYTTADPLELEILLHSPTTGDVLETLYVPDAVFTLPGYAGRVEQKLTPTLNWTSQGGQLFVYQGEK